MGIGLVSTLLASDDLEFKSLTIVFFCFLNNFFDAKSCAINNSFRKGKVHEGVMVCVHPVRWEIIIFFEKKMSHIVADSVKLVS